MERGWRRVKAFTWLKNMNTTVSSNRKETGAGGPAGKLLLLVQTSTVLNAW